MNIVLLDSATLGSDIDTSRLSEFGTVRQHAVTKGTETSERIAEAEIVVTNKVLLDREALSAAKKLRLICLTATGVNNIDLSAAEELGIAVTNVAGYSTAGVAQHTIGCAIALLEQLHYYDAYVKSGAYAESPIFTHLDRTFPELDGKQWGIVGLGTIGRRVAEIASAFGCTIRYFSTSGMNTEAEYPHQPLNDLLSESDVVSIHAPLNDRTQNLIGKSELRRMKTDAILINVGRGGIVDEYELALGLRDGRPRGAALDVFVHEPIDTSNPLLSEDISERLLLTPHIAWASVESRTRLFHEVCENIRAFLSGGRRNRVV